MQFKAKKLIMRQRAIKERSIIVENSIRENGKQYIIHTEAERLPWEKFGWDVASAMHRQWSDGLAFDYRW